MKNKITILMAVALAMALPAGLANAQILTNGSFEVQNPQLGSGAQVTGFDTVTGWSDIGTNSDSGVGDADNAWVEDGNFAAFSQSSDPGAYQITNTAINVGDVLTLTWYAESFYGGAPTQDVSLLLAPTATSSFAASSVLTSNSAALSSSFNEYSLVYTVTPANVGYVGVSFAAPGANGGSYTAFDNFVLTDTPATTTVPEPSTYAFLLAGAGALVFLRRFRRSSV